MKIIAFITLVVLFDRTKNLSWITCYNNICRYGFSNNATGCNQRVIANANAGQHNGICANIYVIPYDNLSETIKVGM